MIRQLSAPRRRKSRASASRPSRRGTTLFELIITLGVVGALSASIVPMLRWTNLQQRESERRMIAQDEVGNLLERLAVLPWSDLRQDFVEAWTPSPTAAARLPESRLAIRIEDQPAATPPARRVRVELSWKVGASHRAAPVRMTAWFHPPKEQRP